MLFRSSPPHVSACAPPVLKTYIVEDSPVIREDLIATLEELTTVRVIGCAEDEATAVQWLKRPDAKIDLLIIDIFLKGGSGLGVLRAAHGLLGNNSCLVVLSNTRHRTCGGAA